MKKFLHKKVLYFSVLCFLLFSTGISVAQNFRVQGNITDELSEPIPGVSIMEKGTTNGTITDIDGNYSIAVTGPDGILVFSFVGYKTQEVPISNRSNLNLQMESDITSLQEVVVVGYGTQKRADVTGAVGSIKTENIANITTGNTSALLQGKVAGVRVENSGGAPGAGTNIVIRGTGTLGGGEPLYIIDGNITNSMAALNPNDIESIEVLKDAAAAAIYGNRAANGVVIITTKRGKAGETQINFSTQLGMQYPTRTLDFLNARQYADHRNMINDNDNQPRALPNNAEFNPDIDTDWQDLYINPAPIREYDLSLSGGNEHATFFISGGILDQDGIVVNSEFQRYNFRANATFTKGRFKLEESLAVSRTVNNPNRYFGRERAEIPTIPVYNPDNDGGFAGVDPGYHGLQRGINWYGLGILNDNKFTTDGVLGNISGSFEIIDGLIYKLNLGIDYSVFHNYNFTPTFFFSTSQEAFNDLADLNESITRGMSTLVENTLNYNKSFGKHNFDFLAGYTEQIFQSRNVGAQVTDFPTNDLRVVSAANIDVNAFGELQENALQSVFGRLNYNYESKYLFSATVRRDGSSRFTRQNRYGTFPSVSAGWRISEEGFFPQGLVNDLKIRGSYGQLGSQNVGNYVTISGLNIYTDYFFAGGVQPGVAQTLFANPNIVWETTESANFGTDFSLFQGKLFVMLDYFNKVSRDVLTNLPIPVYGGVGSSITQNAASIRNRGFEFSSTYNHTPVDKGFGYSVTANLTTIKNQVVELGEGVSPIPGGGFTQEGILATRTEAGHPLGSFYGFVVDGIYQNQQEVDASGRNNVVPGDFKFKDLNNDGEIDNMDRTFLGSPIPKFEYGVIFNATYSNFDLSLFLQGVQGNQIWNGRKFSHIFDFGGNYITDVLNSWTPENPNTNIPRATDIDPANNRRASSFYVEDGSYFRVRSFQLGYSIPLPITERVGISRARIHVSGQNLLTFTKYSGYDPEIGVNANPTQAQGLFGAGVDAEAYPQAKSVFIGINLSF